MIQVQDLAMNYGSFKALDNISFTVNNGEIVGLLGPNGAGKSTTMKILTTYLHPTQGKAFIDGLDVTEKPIEVRKKIGYLPEILPLYLDMEVKDYLEFVASARNLSGAKLKERIEWVVEKTSIQRVYRKLCRELSKGYKQRIGIAQALVHDPEIVILDEPTSGLDPLQISEIRDLIKELGKTKTVILSTHVLQEAQAVSDRIVIINRGRIVGDGTIDSLRDRALAHEKVFVSILGKKEIIETSLNSISGCQSVSYVADNEGYQEFEVHAEKGHKIWNKIGEVARENGWQLGLLKDSPHSLEEIFMALTKEGR